ncbi:hypothetical protein DWU98_12535 [Dyella monticola]|uniref:MFS transporter n=1 Tax=Dyella monticola TaxID=1927958 RepID=A0A370WXA6_9GAMM|nr:hypothetical protein [Dyella monticola]RDS80778.1 hypothetical protein DWU98_12535 [Dyella monticola]
MNIFGHIVSARTDATFAFGMNVNPAEACFAYPLRRMAHGSKRDDRTMAMSVATVSTALSTHRSTYHRSLLSEHTHTDAAATTEWFARGRPLGLRDKSTHAALNQIVNNHAAELAINDVFWSFSLIFAFAVIAICPGKPPFVISDPAGE